MTIKNGRVYEASMRNLSNKLDNYGDANIENLSLLKLIYKYACYATTHTQLNTLDGLVAWLQVNDPLICSEIMANRGSDYVWVPPAVDLTVLASDPPIIVPGGVILDGATTTKTFTSEEIYEGYSDPGGLAPSAFSILSLPATGELKYDGESVTLVAQLTDPTLLTYERAGTSAYGETFNLTAWNSSSFAATESALVAFPLTIEEFGNGNLAPTVGDRAQYAGNRSITVFTVADFTSLTIAPYFDPEGNELDAIRVDEISTANSGSYYYFGAPVVAGQIITKDEIEQGAFYHSGPDANAISTDSFNASLRDDVNMTWVS